MKLVVGQCRYEVVLLLLATVCNLVRDALWWLAIGDCDLVFFVVLQV